LHKHAGEQTRRAAKLFLQQFKDEGCIQLILDRAMNEESLSDAGKVLLDLGGITALGLILDLLKDKLPRTIETDLQSAAAERSPEELRKVLQWRAERGWEALRPIFPVIRRVEPGIAAGLLEGLLVHEELEVRREALLTLIAFGQQETLLRSLRRGLADGDPRFVTVVVRSLVDLRCEQAVELLGAYIEGGLSLAPPTLECGSLAVRGLALKGDAGVERLCLCLDRLSGSYRPIKMRLALRVRDALKLHATSSDVSGRLRRWRFSPAGLIEWLRRGKRACGAKGEE